MRREESDRSPIDGHEVVPKILVKPKSTSQEPYNHFSLLRTIEDLFGLKHIGYAGAAEVQSFEPSLFIAKSSR
jgi:hypothetical protein